MQSENINELAAALAKAQGDMGNATLNKVNPHFKSKYADLASVRDAVIPSLAKHGIAMVQLIGPTDTGWTLTTRLVHSSGQWLASTYPLPSASAKPQEFMSALTYARRGSLSAICGISADEDDDGNAAQGKPPLQAKDAAKERDRRLPSIDDVTGIMREPDVDDAARTKAIAWAEKASKAVALIKSAPELDAFEEKHAAAFERLRELDRPSWESLKRYVTDRAAALDPATLLTAG